MTGFVSLIGMIIPRASAAVIEQLGQGAPGIDGMWDQFKQIFPHTDLGSGGLSFLLLTITNIILRFIGGIAVLMIVYGGIKMIMTVYDESAHGEAKKVVISACVGLILCTLADAVVMYVIYLLQMATGGA